MTAICLFGHFRTFEKTSTEWKRIFNENCHFFFHTWNTFGESNLNEQQINLLRSFDKDVVIDDQSLIPELLKLSKIKESKPQKWAKRSLLKRLLNSTVLIDKVILTRYDVLPTENLCNFNVFAGEIKTSYMYNELQKRNSCMGDVSIFHSSDIKQYYKVLENDYDIQTRNEDVNLYYYNLVFKQIFENVLLGKDADIVRENFSLLSQYEAKIYAKNRKIRLFILIAAALACFFLLKSLKVIPLLK